MLNKSLVTEREFEHVDLALKHIMRELITLRRSLLARPGARISAQAVVINALNNEADAINTTHKRLDTLVTAAIYRA